MATKLSADDVAEILRAMSTSLREMPGQIVGSITSVGYVAKNTGGAGFVNRGGSIVNAPVIHVGAAGPDEGAITDALERLIAVLEDHPDEGRVQAVWTSVVAQLPPFIIQASAGLFALAGWEHLARIH